MERHRLRILFIAKAPAAPMTGAGIRLVRLISGAARNHDVETILLAEQDGPVTPGVSCVLHVLRRRVCTHAGGGDHRAPTHNFVRAIVGGNCDVTCGYDPACAEEIADLVRVRAPDIVQFESSSLSLYVNDLRHRLPRVPILLDCYDLEWLIRVQIAMNQSGLRKKVKAYVQALNMARLERRAFASATLTFMTNRREQGVARWMAPSARFMLLPNGADFSDGAPPSALGIDGRILFIGNMKYLPNADGITWFAREIWPTIRRLCPNASLDIVGRDPRPEVLSLQAQSGVRVTGSVEDVRPYLVAAQVFIVPLRMGTGTRLKILEALAAGKAVVSTRVGTAGLDLVPGRHLLTADSAKGFASATVRLLADSDTRCALGCKGREYAREKYDWGVILRKAEQACAAIEAECPRD